MQITKREFLRRLGLGGAGIAGGVALGDEYVATKNRLPPGSIGDPDSPNFGKNIFPLGHTIEDGPSCFLRDGKIIQPAREIPLFMRRTWWSWVAARLASLPRLRRRAKA